MEETNSTQVNSFEQAMKGEGPAGQPTPSDSYSVNPTAESVLNVLAVIMLIIGIIGGLLIFIPSALKLDDMGAHPMEFFRAILVGPAFFCFTGLLPWAGIKVYINMSRNLFAIREELHQLKDRV